MAPGNELLSSLSGMQETIDAKMDSSKLSIFKVMRRYCRNSGICVET